MPQWPLFLHHCCPWLGRVELLCHCHCHRWPPSCLPTRGAEQQVAHCPPPLLHRCQPRLLPQLACAWARPAQHACHWQRAGRRQQQGLQVQAEAAVLLRLQRRGPPQHLVLPRYLLACSCDRRAAAWACLHRARLQARCGPRWQVVRQVQAERVHVPPSALPAGALRRCSWGRPGRAAVRSQPFPARGCRSDWVVQTLLLPAAGCHVAGVAAAEEPPLPSPQQGFRCGDPAGARPAEQEARDAGMEYEHHTRSELRMREGSGTRQGKAGAQLGD